MKKVCSLCIAGIFLQTAHAQISGLNVGDKMPDIYLGKCLDDPSKKIKLSDLKGKLVILDFWNIRCSVCITGMPKMDSLQKKFNDQLQIIAVTYNNKEEVEKLFKKVRIKRPQFPFIIEDSVLNALFPHQGDPLHVWINTQGFVSAITFDYNTNNETVTQFLNGIDPKLSRRWDFGFNIQYPLVSEQNSALSDMATNYSILFSGLDEYTDHHSIRINENQIQVVNGELTRLYKIAYNNEVYGFNVNNIILKTNNRIIFEVKDPVPFFPPEEEVKIAAWLKENTFSYEIKLPENKSDKKFLYMREDLQRYLPYKASIEKRKTKCLVLVSTGKDEPLKTKMPDAIPLMEPMTKSNSLVLQNEPVQVLVSQILYSNPYYPIPIVDGTDFSNNIDITLKSKLSSIEALNRELESLGLGLVEQEREIDMLVIRDQ